MCLGNAVLQDVVPCFGSWSAQGFLRLLCLTLASMPADRPVYVEAKDLPDDFFIKQPWSWYYRKSEPEQPVVKLGKLRKA